MKLIECYIREFGGIKDKSFRFGEGLCSFIGKNGAGKTTLTAFIKAMLYGIGDTKRARLDENDRRHYLPRSGGVAGGTLTVSVANGIYRIERSFGKRASDDTCVIYDARTGRESTEYSERFGEEIFGIDVNGFERTLYLSERNLSPATDPDSISARLSSLAGTDMDIDAVETARRVLDDQRRFYVKKGGGGEIASTRAEISRLDGEIYQLKNAEERLNIISDEMDKARRLEEQLLEEYEQISRRSEALKHRDVKDAIDGRVAKLREELARLTGEKEELMLFFDGEVPSYSEIERHKQMKNEAQMLLRGGITEADRREYEGLSSFFSYRCSPEDVENARQCTVEICENERELEKMRRENGGLFALRTPKATEVENIIEIYGRKKSGMGVFALLTLVLGIIALIGGALCGYFINSLFYYAGYCGGVITLFGTVLLCIRFCRRKRAIGKAEEFIRSVTGDLPERGRDIGALLNDMLSVTREIEQIEKARRTLICEISEFLSKFFTRVDQNPVSTAEEIIKQYDKYISLKSLLSYSEEYSAAAGDRGDRLLEAVAEFLARYRISAENAFAELEDAVRNYEKVTSGIISLRGEIEGLTSMHRIYGDDGKCTADSADKIRRDKSLLDEKMRKNRTERAEMEIEYKDMTRAISELDGLTVERDRLRTRVEKSEKNARIIALATSHLNRAAENMTEKYLGKSRERLKHYASLLSGHGGRSADITNELSTLITENGITSQTDAYSRGERELYQLCARLALIDALFCDESPFIILDDPFISFDDERINAARAMLQNPGLEKQILYFTCSESRSMRGATVI